MTVKAAVIGVGYLGKHHARIYSSLDDVSLVAVVDTDISLAEKIAGEYGCDAVGDYRDILDQVEAVSIVTPTITHYEIAVECLNAGKHLLVEKPITATVEESDKLIEVARKQGKVVQVGHLERYNPAVIAVRDMISEPGFIESERLAPFQPRGTDVDVTLDLMIHDIDIVLSLLGEEEVADVRVVGMKVLTGKLDIAKAWLEFKGGAKALITASRIAQEKRRALDIHQRDSFIHVDYMNMKIQRSLRKGDGIVSESIEISEHEPLREEIKDFVRCVKEGSEPLVSASDGRRALKLALEITGMINEAGG